MRTDCIFCQMTRNERPCHIIDSNDEFMVFLTIFPNTLGATVVIPKKHYSSYAFDLDDEVLTGLMLYTKKVAKKLDEFFDDVGRTAMVFEGFGDLPSTVRFGLNFVAHLNMDLFFLLTL